MSTTGGICGACGQWSGSFEVHHCNSYFWNKTNRIDLNPSPGSPGGWNISGGTCGLCGGPWGVGDHRQCHAKKAYLKKEEPMEKIKLSETEKSELKELSTRIQEEIEKSGDSLSKQFIFDIGYLFGTIHRITE